MQIRLSLIFILVSNLLTLYPASTIQNGDKSLILPIGGDYLNLTTSSTAALANAKNGIVNILVLPIAMASDPYNISASEREDLLKTADTLRAEIEKSCTLNALQNLTCNTVLAPILTRPDARSRTVSKYFKVPLSEIFILDGSQTIAMDVIGGTPVELALTQAYQNGVVIAGTGGGGVIQSSSMMGGYNPGYSAENSMDFGAPDVWDSAEKRGLLFGLQTAILDDRFFQDNHFSRLLNAITMPEAPPIGIGIDTNTSAYIPGEIRIENISGSGTVTILDGATYHASESVRYVGLNHLLSVRNVIVNLLAPGNYSYDLLTRQTSIHPTSPLIERSFETLILPENAGGLWLSGDLKGSLGGNKILERFVRASGGTGANILVVATGYPSDIIAQSTAVEYARALNANSSIYVIHQSVFPSELLTGYTGILLLGGEQSLIDPKKLEPIKNAWLSNMPLMVVNAASAIAGEFFIVDPSESNTMGLTKNSAKSSSILDANIQPGLSLLHLTIQPGVMDNNQWGSVISLAYNHPELINLGLNNHTAIEISKNGASVLGENVVFIMDLRSATLALGSNNAYVIANGLIDSYANDESIEPQVADISSAPERLSTPIIATPTATRLPTSTPRPTATHRPTGTPTIEPTPTKRVKASPTPLIIPPPSDPATRSMMVAFGVLIAFLVAIGVWINRKRIFYS
jgi:cyanophycinase-like exopeptidase